MINIEPVYAIHPTWIELTTDSIGAETGAVIITDVLNPKDFGQRWKNLPSSIQSEFGFESPLFERGDQGHSRRFLTTKYCSRSKCDDIITNRE